MGKTAVLHLLKIGGKALVFNEQGRRNAAYFWHFNLTTIF
jgi:hypothetical protein